MMDVVVPSRGADRYGLAVAVLAAVFSLIASLASAQEIAAAAQAEAGTVWQQRCSTCLGAQ